MENKLGAAMMSAERVVAVDHRRVDSGEFDKDYVLAQGVAEHLNDPTESSIASYRNGTIGCYLSHLSLLERLQKARLGNQTIALILEDDVSIPDTWVPQLKAVLAAAPQDWTVLKVAGWGSARDGDEVHLNEGTWFWNRVARPLVSLIAGSSTSKRTYSIYKTKPPFKSILTQVSEKADKLTGPKTTKEATYYYAGSSGYLVRGASLPTLIQHLRSQRITDFDEMLLSGGKHNAYEFWPHVFDASGDHLKSSIHSSLVQQEVAVEPDSV